MGIDEFLENLGQRNKKREESKEKKPSWEEIFAPSEEGDFGKVAAILGKRGAGKSALAYFLTERLSRKYNLLPVAINLPREKQDLLPPSWVIKSLKEVQQTENACALIDEGTTMIPAGAKKLADLVKGFVALARQRQMVLIFIYHSAADLDARIFRGIDIMLLKEPSRRQIEFGSKDNWMKGLLEESKRHFSSIREIKGDPREFTFVDSEDPEFRGLLRNPLCSFWQAELSRAWAGIDTIEDGLYEGKQLEILGVGERIGYYPDVEHKGKYLLVTANMQERRTKVDKSSCQSGYIEYVDDLTGIHWIEKSY